MKNFEEEFKKVMKHACVSYLEFEESTYDLDEDRPIVDGGYVIGIYFDEKEGLSYSIDKGGFLFHFPYNKLSEEDQEYLYDEAYAYYVGDEGFDDDEDDDEEDEITQEEAIKKVYAGLEDTDNLKDILYGVAHDMFTELVDKVEQKHTVVDEDGEEWTDDDDVTWYDEEHDAFIQEFFNKISHL